MGRYIIKKYISYLCVVFIVIMGLAFIVGTSEEDDEVICFTYSATGNFTYTSETKVLTMKVDVSNFPADVGIEGTHTVKSISDTEMIWIDDKDDELIWSREPGIPDNIDGVWLRTVSGIHYSLTMNSDDSTFSLTGKNCI